MQASQETTEAIWSSENTTEKPTRPKGTTSSKHAREKTSSTPGITTSNQEIEGISGSQGISSTEQAGKETSAKGHTCQPQGRVQISLAPAWKNTLRARETTETSKEPASDEDTLMRALSLSRRGECKTCLAGYFGNVASSSTLSLYYIIFVI